MAIALLYQVQNLKVRSSRALLTILGVGLVVAVFCYLLCFADGLRRALALSGDARNLIIIAEPATAESNSAISHEDVGRLHGVPHVGGDSRGRPLVSPEIVVHTNLTRRGDDARTKANVVVRGLDLEMALQVHPAVEIIAGRWFQSGADELVVGTAAAQQFAHAEPGSVVDCGDRTFAIVGVFRAGGGVHESELWGYSSNVADAYRRRTYSSAVLRLNSADQACVAQAVERIASAAVALRALPEPAYFTAQAANARILEDMALGLVLIMGVGAVFAAMNTMHAAVAGRTREIGMLRAIGFSSMRITFGILAESVALAVTGGVAGCLACVLAILLDRGTKDLVGSATFTSVAFTVRVSYADLAISLAVAALIGLLGGIWPARAAIRMPVVEALRST